jgi:hypothetical protein
VLALIGFACALAPASARADSSGAAIYAAHCSACHGVDGKGAPQNLVKFDVPLPDFTDCNFATREPQLDWYASAHDGGPARGFNRMMAAFGEALSRSQLMSALQHMRSFCRDRSWPRGELNFPLARFTEKAFPEDELVLTSSVATEGSLDVSGELIYEKRLGARNQLDVVVPYGVARQEDGHLVGGLQDIGIGVKRAFVASLESGTIFAAAGELFLPTGNEDKGLGLGTFMFEPYLALGQRLPAACSIQLQAGAELPFNRAKSKGEAFWRVAVAKSFHSGEFGRMWSPIVEVIGARALEDGASPEWDVVPQMQVTLSTRQHIRVNAGARIPLNKTDERPVSVVVYVLWDWFDGGLTQGW